MLLVVFMPCEHGRIITLERILSLFNLLPGYTEITPANKFEQV